MKIKLIALFLVSLVLCESNLCFGGDKFPMNFTSTDGHYGFKIKLSEIVYPITMTDIKTLNKLWINNSKEGLWTNAGILHNYIENGRPVKEISQGNDLLIRFFEKEKASVLINWSPIKDDLEQNLKDVILHLKQIGARIEGVQYKTVVGGKKGLGIKCTQYSKEGKEYITYIVTHGGDRRFDIVFIYTGGYNDPEKTLPKILESFIFRK